MNSADLIRHPTPEQVAAAFLTPQAPQHRRALELTGGESIRITTPEGEVALRLAGGGPPVLLLHGWEGQASDLEAFATPLRASGLAVVAPDLPAHGESTGHRSSIPQAARALRSLGKAFGPFRGAIAHSVGAAVLTEALHAGLEVERVVMIAAPASYEDHARRFASAAGLDAAGTEAMLALLRDAMGVDLREISLPSRAAHQRRPALFIHSGDDRVVAIEDSLASAAAWPQSRHLRVEGLGHRRILFDPFVIDAAVHFVGQPI